MSHEVDWTRVGKMPIRTQSELTNFSWRIKNPEFNGFFSLRNATVFSDQKIQSSKGHLGSNLGHFFTYTFLRRLRKSSSGVGTIDWRLKYENESFEWFKSHYCINQYCNEHEFILDILEVNIRGRKLSNFRFEFGDFNSKLIHFFGFSQTGSDQFFCWIFRKILILRIWT